MLYLLFLEVCHLSVSLNSIENCFSIYISDETGSYDDLDDSLIPQWLFSESSMNESSLLIRDNLDCIIDHDSPIRASFHELPGSQPVFVPEPVYPIPNLNYIRVSLLSKVR